MTDPLSTGPAPSPTEPPQLLRALGAWETASIAIGIMIGTAIFLVPADVTAAVGSPSTALAVWTIGGVLSLFGALSFAEMAAMMPQAGGQYVYLREAYGPLTSFLCGWAFFLAAQGGGISVLAVGFAEYLGEFLPLMRWHQQCAAAASIVLFTIINYRGVKEGGRVQSLLTGIKVGAIVVLILLGFVLVRGTPAGHGTIHAPSGSGFLAAFGVALVGVLWAFEGWNTCTFAAGEVKNPQRDLPRALILGTIAVIGLYVALNLVYYRVLTVSEVAASKRVGADAAVRIFGHAGAQFVSLLIIVSTLGSLNGSILAAPRVYYAMAKDGQFFRWCAEIHPKYHTPHRALLVQCVWAVLLVVLGTYNELFTYVVFAAWIFYALTGYAVIILRRKLPELPRPYRVTGYPWVPIAFVLASVWFLVNTLFEKPAESGLGTLMVLVGVPVYLFWQRRGAVSK
ncbi:MAG: amino acid permease [Acidobacteria bacterium]|nr:amino acid permease [Acidobacteriota bacterium]